MFLNWLLGAALGWLLYPILVQAPLHILNALYKAFQYCCMVPVGEVFFGGSRESLQWNMNSPLMQFMIMGIIIAVVIIAIMFIALLIEHSIGRKQVNFMSKLKWPMIAIVSIIGIPIGFILFSGLATALLQLIGGTAVQNYIAVANVSSIITTMNNGLTELAKSFNLDINIKDVAGGTIAMKMDTTINLLIEAFKKLSEEAGKQALTTIQEKINLIIENLSQMKVSFANVMENVAKLNMEINSYLSNPAHWNGANVKPLDEEAQVINGLIDSINRFQMKWLSIITAAREININCKDILISAGSVDFEGHTYDIFNLLDNLTNQNVAWTTSYWANFNTYWINGIAENQTCLWQCICQGGKWKNITFDKTTQCYLNMVQQGIDPQQCNSFNLVIQIYQLATGRCDTNWAAYNVETFGELSLLNLLVSFVCIAACIYCVALFSIFAARRLIELAVLAVFGVVSAGFGVRDDGIKFKNSIKLLAAKMFSIVICYACFVVGITLLTTITHSFNNLGESGLTEGMLKVILMAGGLIGAYHIANAISKQFGDSHSLQETMGDIGLIKTAMGAAGGGLMLMGLKKGAMAGGKKAFGGIKGGIRGKYMSGVQNITDRKMKLALNEGLVKREHKIGADGKSHQVFSFKDKGSQVTQDRYNQIMNMSKKDLRRAEMSAAAKSSAKTAAKASAQQAKSSAQSLKANASAE